jgi:hypothetical protein
MDMIFMRTSAVAFVIASSILGCGGDTQVNEKPPGTEESPNGIVENESSTPPRGADEKAVREPEVSQELTEFREHVAEYLDEARIGAKLLESSPSAQRVQEQADKMVDLYIRIPDVPAEIKSADKVATALDGIRLAFHTADLLGIKGREESVRAIRGSADVVEGIVFPDRR